MHGDLNMTCTVVGKLKARRLVAHEMLRALVLYHVTSKTIKRRCNDA